MPDKAKPKTTAASVKPATAKPAATRRRTAAAKDAPVAPAAAVESAATTEAEAPADALYEALLGKVREEVEGVQEKPNTSGTYTRLLTKDGKAFAYVYPPRKAGVALKIPKQLLGVAADLPVGHGFKTTGWGLTRTLKAEAETQVVAKSLGVAAHAVEAGKS